MTDPQKHDTKLKAIIFDLYGTLIYTPGTDFMVRFDDLKTNLGHMSNFPTHETILTQEYETLWPKAITETEAWTNDHEATEEILNGCMLYPGSLELLTGLRALGLKIGVISNVSTPYKRPFFELGLSKHIDHVAFSCELGVKKPDPKIFEIFNKTFCVHPSNILFCGDSAVNDMELANSCGITGVLVDHESHKHFSCVDGEYSTCLSHPRSCGDGILKVTSLVEILDLVKKLLNKS